MSLDDVYMNSTGLADWLYRCMTSYTEELKTLIIAGIGIGIGVVVVLGIVIIVNQIKIKKMLRKLTEEQDKPERMR